MGPAGLARWEREIGDTVSEEAIAEIWAHPRFQDAMRLSVETALALTESNPVYHTNFRDLGRLTLAVIALYLDATGGLTHRRMRELSGDVGMLSAGRATAILFQLRMIGYIVPTATRADGSATRYAPTQKMKEAFRARIRTELASIALLEPEMETLLARFDDDEVFRVYIAHLGSTFGRGIPREDMAGFNALSARNSALLILYNLLHAADTGGEFPPHGHAPISVAALARRFGVSRAHVLRILREAEQNGFVSHGKGEEGVTIHPLLCEKFRLTYAVTYIVFGALGHRTLVTLSQPTARAAQ